MAGCDLGFVIGRRSHRQQGKGLLFVTPLVGPKQIDAATETGFHRSENMHCLQLTRRDEPGMAYRVSAALAGAGINVKGISAASLNREFIMFLAFDKEADAIKAMEVLKKSV